jgi:hypothetical protein
VELFDKEKLWKSTDGRLGILGGFGVGGSLSDSEISVLVKRRETARQARDYATADKIRQDLKTHGVDISDKDGMWKAHDGRMGMLGGDGAPGGMGHMGGMGGMGMGMGGIGLGMGGGMGALAMGNAMGGGYGMAAGGGGRNGMDSAQGNGMFAHMGQMGFGADFGMGGMMGGGGMQQQHHGFGPGQGHQSHHQSQQSHQAHGYSAGGAGAGVSAGGGTGGMSDEQISNLIGQREHARRDKDWSTADKLREELRAQGVEVYDKDKVWRASDGRQGQISRWN